eukprot:5088050-Amphidinium_carterae.1
MSALIWNDGRVPLRDEFPAHDTRSSPHDQVAKYTEYQGATPEFKGDSSSTKTRLNIQQDDLDVPDETVHC